jgi:hypothetical protein
MVLQFGAIANIVGGLVEVARMVSSRIPKKESGVTDARLPSLEERVAALEKIQGEQTPLVQKLAEQLENVAAAGEKLNQRVTLLLAVSAGALLLSIVALLVEFLR